jgi:hypothetical protein
MVSEILRAQWLYPVTPVIPQLWVWLQRRSVAPHSLLDILSLFWDKSFLEGN